MFKKINKKPKKYIFCFDIDNTICSTRGNDYLNSKPKKNIIKLINQLYNNGHIIKLFTSRFMGRSKEKVVVAKKKGYTLTKKQLEKWGLNYHSLIMGKPSYDYIIDDKSINFNKNCIKKIKIFLKS